MHEFAGGVNDGSQSRAGLTQSGSTLFGTTQQGGDNNAGTVFSIETDSTGFTLLHEFAGGANDGRNPVAELTLSGATLFGTTYRGGDNDRGTIFSLEIIPEPGSLILVLLGGLVAADTSAVRRGRERWLAGR